MIASLLAAALVVPPPAGTDTRRILDALRQVETGGSRDPDRAVGDDGGQDRIDGRELRRCVTSHVSCPP
jgi:hypothetical protein